MSCDDIFFLKQIIDANDFSIQQSAQNETAFHPLDDNRNGIIEFRTEIDINV